MPQIDFDLIVASIAALQVDPAILLVLAITALGGAFRFFTRRRRPKRVSTSKPVAVLDGSNVMYWHGGQPRASSVKNAVRVMQKRGFAVYVVFDANAGHLLDGRFRGDRYFAQVLGLTASHIHVVHKGEPADPHILHFAQKNGAYVVSNDRFRDWRREFPKLNHKKFLRGGYRDGRLWVAQPKS